MGDIFSPMNIVKKSGNKNVYETISNNDTYSMNDFGKKYKARNTFRSLNVPDLLSRITEKYSFNQIQKLLARAKFYLATMYSRKLISMLLYHSHSIRHLNLLPFDKNQLIKEEKITSSTSLHSPSHSNSESNEVKEEKEQKDEKSEEISTEVLEIANDVN